MPGNLEAGSHTIRTNVRIQARNPYSARILCLAGGDPFEDVRRPAVVSEEDGVLVVLGLVALLVARGAGV